MSETSEVCAIGIAIVEDEKDLVKAYRKAFAKHGIQVCFVAYDGVEAVKKYLESAPRPHVIIMDYRLPIMNGIDATKKILTTDPDASIIFLSADIQVKAEAMQAGAFSFLKKPAELKDIIDSTMRAMNMKMADAA